MKEKERRAIREKKEGGEIFRRENIIKKILNNIKMGIEKEERV